MTTRMLFDEMTISPRAMQVIQERFDERLNTQITKRLGAWSKDRFHYELSKELLEAMGGQVIGNDDYQWMIDFVYQDTLKKHFDAKQSICGLAFWLALNDYEEMTEDLKVVDFETGEHKPMDRSILGQHNPYLKKKQ